MTSENIIAFCVSMVVSAAYTRAVQSLFVRRARRQERNRLRAIVEEEKDRCLRNADYGGTETCNMILDAMSEEMLEKVGEK